MFRKAFTVVMIVAIGLHTGGAAFLYFWYLVANASFEQNFCINIERPELQCHGKCHLSKIALEKQPQKQTQVPNPSGEEEGRPRSPYQEPEAGLLAPAVWVILSAGQDHFRYGGFSDILLVHSVFHPPRRA